MGCITLIQAHPYARSYRTKSLPNYKDLGLIFGDATNNGIQGNLLQDKDLEDDVVGAKSGVSHFCTSDLGFLLYKARTDFNRLEALSYFYFQFYPCNLFSP